MIGLNTAIERARAQALSGRRRLLADLDKIQNERFLRTELLNAKLLDQRAEILESTTGSVKKVLTEFNALRALVHRNPEENVRLEIAQVCKESNDLLEQARQNIQQKKSQNEANPPAPQEAAAETSATNRTQSTPCNAPCPCHSGQKFKRCCGQNARPVLQAAA